MRKLGDFMWNGPGMRMVNFALLVLFAVIAIGERNLLMVILASAGAAACLISPNRVRQSEPGL